MPSPTLRRSRTTAMSNGGVLKTIMGVFTAAEAFVTGPTQILDGVFLCRDDLGLICIS